MSYEISFARVPFDADEGVVVRLGQPGHPKGPEHDIAPGKHQPKTNLVDELDRKIPFRYAKEFSSPSDYPGHNLDSLAKINSPQCGPSDIRIGDYYYPYGATRFSVFRGLATSTKAAAMLFATQGRYTATFTMKSVVAGAGARLAASSIVSTPMHMLPPRPLAEHGGGMDGLYLITLVDERFYWDGSLVLLSPTERSTWVSLIDSLSAALGITITYSAISTDYTQPEPDSQLWSQAENAAVLLDAVALNIGRRVVRNLDGTYALLTPAESKTRAVANRGLVTTLARHMGGDMFNSGGTVKVGNLYNSKNIIVPRSVSVCYPKYVIGNDPVPHFLNPRYRPSRPSTWNEDSYGSVYSVSVPVLSGGLAVSGYVDTSGLVGSSTEVITSTAKALYSGEVQAGLDPLNNSGLVALAMQITRDFYGSQVATALDEVYPGIATMSPEGIHDIVWSYSVRSRGATTRTIRSQWDQVVKHLQHGTPVLSGQVVNLRGTAGHSVAQAVRDSYSGSVTCLLEDTLASGGYQAVFNHVGFFPTQNRWKGTVEGEDVLFEGTSGGSLKASLSGAAYVNIVHRGIDGTVQKDHISGSTVSMAVPNTTFGTNLVSWEKGQFVHPHEHTSGGIQGAKIVPQIQTIRVLSASGRTSRDVTYYSGRVQLFDSTRSGNPWDECEYAWVVDRNDDEVISGKRYGGQLVGYSSSGSTAPIYAINHNLGDCSIGIVTNVCLISGFGISSGFNIEYSLYDMATCQITARYCVTNPTVCCQTAGGGTGGGGEGGALWCCPGFTYNTLTATVTNPGSCTCLTGVSFTCTWNGTNWSGSASACGGTVICTITTSCSLGLGGAVQSTTGIFSPASCDPLIATVGVNMTAGCTGSVVLAITE